MSKSIIDAPVSVTGYLGQVRQLANPNRNPLGFLPTTTHEEAAMKSGSSGNRVGR